MTEEQITNAFKETEYAIDSQWIETPQSTLLDAFIYLTRNLGDENIGRNRRLQSVDSNDTDALRFLMRRLDMTPSQVFMLACIILDSQGLGRTCDMEDMANEIGIHPLTLLSHKEELNDLVERGYLEEDLNHMNVTQYSVRKEAMDSICRNKTFNTQSLRVNDSITFLSQCMKSLRDAERNDSEEIVARHIDWLFRLNDHLPVSRNIQRIAAGDDLVLKPLIIAASLIGGNMDTFFEIRDFSRLLPLYDVRSIHKAIQRGTYPLVERKIFEPLSSAEGMADAERWVISREGWMEIFSDNMEDVNAVIANSDVLARNMLACKNIPERQLFFSGKTEEQVNRLREMLNEEHYHRIVSRLKEKNLPTGLNILLYGTPGTGKTELVQQLARETGRDLFVVDMSQIRDKYVGESEQNLARIFTTYRSYVTRMKRTPILFCNECDAIFGERMEHTARSVDKMENALQNILLEQMEKLRGIMICTTNLTSALDKAFERRFLIKLQLPKPTNEARKLIWSSMLPALSDEQAATLANRFDFSGGQIQNVTRKQIINSIFTGSDEMDFDRILADCSAESMDRSNGKQIGFK